MLSTKPKRSGTLGQKVTTGRRDVACCELPVNPGTRKLTLLLAPTPTETYGPDFGAAVEKLPSASYSARDLPDCPCPFLPCPASGTENKTDNVGFQEVSRCPSFNGPTAPTSSKLLREQVVQKNLHLVLGHCQIVV